MFAPSHFRVLSAVAAACLFGTVAIAQADATELVVNGSFELPALSGNGDIYSTEAAFSLPGWTVPTGGNQFFLEFGQPFGVPRFSDGNQVVCLNGDGTPVAMSQTLNTVVGQTYLLSFDLGEESLARPSVSAVTVDFGPLTQVFTLGDNEGFATFTLDLEAVSTQTILRFSDATPSSAGLDSPFIDAVSVIGTEGQPAAVPLPPTALPALGTLVGLGLIHLRRRRMA
jgi:hypothetical protein